MPRRPRFAIEGPGGMPNSMTRRNGLSRLRAVSVPGLLLLNLLSFVCPPATASAPETAAADETPSLEHLLRRAARGGNAVSVLTLLEGGAAIDAANGNGGTPLMYAAVGGHTRIVALLLERGANVNAQGTNGWSALMLASAKGHVRVVRQLLAAGADVNRPDVYRWTPLMRAVYERRPAVVAALLNHPQVAVNAVSDQGSSALHLAAIVGERGSVVELIEHGADPGLRDHAGRTPADIAEARRDLDLARMLRWPAAAQ